jgi:Zn-dependent protease/predicted transcriptional regulator
MSGGLKVARLFGINIFIDWSWIFIFMLVTWNLAFLVFPQVQPEWGLGLTVGLSLLASVLFFGSVLAHEMAHSLVAKARGLPVRRITLFIFGGAADIGREPRSPGDEFLIAVVGPITSVVLGIVFLVLGIFLLNGSALVGEELTQTLAAIGPFATMLLWLGPINILLGVFNMVPGFPLDGGRILRSILWKITNNMLRATRLATFVGQLIAWIFIGTGVAMVLGIRIPIFGTGILPGMWLAFIGWFLNNAASASYQQTVVQDLLEGVPVERLMRSDLTTVEPYTSVSQLVYDNIMGTEDKAYPVLYDERLVGVVYLSDVKKVSREDWETTLVRDIMTPADQVAVVGPREEASEALVKLSRRNVEQLPVVHGNQFVGMLRQRDVIRWLQIHANITTGSNT